jgi:6-pyruvoyltetrahydropterin/6-carboxytetrahydropterin synthase
MIECARKFHFCAGHRVFGHENKCAHPHGHNYTVYVEARPWRLHKDELDDVGRVVDFSVLKEKIGGWIDDNWDHAFLLYEQDTECAGALAMVANSKVFKLPYNPTAENMAKFLLNYVCPSLLLETHVKVEKVIVWETDNCYATATIG